MKFGDRKKVVHKTPDKENLTYEASLSCSTTLRTYIPKISEESENIPPQQHTGIVDSGATNLYIAPNAPHGPLDTKATKIIVGTANVQVAT